jgi:hypothetical protein
MEENQKIEDVVNRESRFETVAVAESAIKECKQGEIIQLERRGYFYVDRLATNDSPMYLHFVPDGKMKNQSNIETKINVKTLSKGDDNEDGKKKKQEKKNKEKKEKKSDQTSEVQENKANEENK